MSFRRVEFPTLKRVLSNIMAHPSSADPEACEMALDEYARLGGNCIHLHGEGGETHTRRATGRWLQERDLRRDFFLCTQIGHAGWDEAAGRAIDRFTAAAVSEDVDTDLDLLGTEYLDFVYLDDSPQAPFAPVIEAIAREIGGGRVLAFGVRNWNAQRLSAAQEYASSASLPPVAAMVTTELALANASAPLWPEYVPFDRELRQVAEVQSLPVFAHASDINLGQCLFGDEDDTARLRRHWVERWHSSENEALVHHVKNVAGGQGFTTREVNIAWLLNQRFPSVAILPLPQMLTERGSQYERASRILLNEADRALLRLNAPEK